MLHLQRMDAELFQQKLLICPAPPLPSLDAPPEPGPPQPESEPESATDYSLLKLEHSMLKMTSAVACQGVFYLVAIKTGDDEVVAR